MLNFSRDSATPRIPHPQGVAESRIFLVKIGLKSTQIPHNPIVSPLYGDMHCWPPTDIYSGTWETLYTDIVKTHDKMKGAGVDVCLHAAPKMGHVYPLWLCPEGSKVRKEIAKIIMQ